MSDLSKNQDPFTPKQEVSIPGAFEIFEGNREELNTLTRNGRLLQPGDIVPVLPGVELGGIPFILHTVNAFGTETCDTCTDELEAFHLARPEIPVISLTKQTPEEIMAEDAKRIEAGKPAVTHNRITIDQDTAIDLGVALEAGEGADKEFWPTALRRTLILADRNGRIIDIEQPDDQEQKPDFMRFFEQVENIG
jgi:hypothetical protein